MTAALETNTEALREILQTVNTLPEAGSVATEQVFIATRETTYSELQQQGPAKACFFSDEEGFIYPLTGYTGEAYVFSGVRDDLKRLDRYVIRDDGKGFVYEIRALPGYPDWSHLKWYVMGDSLTAQDNTYTEKRYYDFVQEKTGIRVILDGIGGTGYGAGASSGQSFLDRVKNIPADVDVVTIFGSGNDILYTDIASVPIYDALKWLAFNRPGLRVIVAPPAPWKDYPKRNDPWKAYCDRLQVCALACDFRYLSDLYDCPPFNGNFEGHMETFFTTDSSGIHPNEAGHEMLAPYFYNALLQELALKV